MHLYNTSDDIIYTKPAIESGCVLYIFIVSYVVYSRSKSYRRMWGTMSVCKRKMNRMRDGESVYERCSRSTFHQKTHREIKYLLEESEEENICTKAYIHARLYPFARISYALNQNVHTTTATVAFETN